MLFFNCRLCISFMSESLVGLLNRPFRQTLKKIFVNVSVLFLCEYIDRQRYQY